MTKAIEKRRLQLLELARQQGGYFTAAQAAACGFDNANQFRYVGDGRWERVRRGIFRLASEPISPQADLHIISLFLRRRDGRFGGVFGLETAAQIHGLGDFMPSSIHVLVAGRLRKRAELPPELVLSRSGDLTTEVQVIDGLPVTSTLRTIADLLAAPDRDHEDVRRAFLEGRRAGLISADKLQSMDRWLSPEISATIRSWKLGT